jgi:hypothetical protein
MDSCAIVERVIEEYAAIPYAYEPELRLVPVFDRARGQFLLMVAGWGAKRERVHYCMIHITLSEGKYWIEEDTTEEGVAADLERAGIPRDQIVLAFHRPEIRPHTGYAVA